MHWCRDERMALIHCSTLLADFIKSDTSETRSRWLINPNMLPWFTAWLLRADDDVIKTFVELECDWSKQPASFLSRPLIEGSTHV